MSRTATVGEQRVARREARRRLRFGNRLASMPYERRVDTMISTADVIDSNMSEMWKNIRRMQSKLDEADMEELPRTRLRYVTAKVASHMSKATAWLRELSSDLEEEQEKEVQTTQGPAVDQLIADMEAEKQAAIKEAVDQAREDVRKCVICWTNNKAETLIPCSHTFCKDCVEKMVASEGSKCAFCRAKIHTFFPVLLTE
jgi:hypothetical protein